MGFNIFIFIYRIRLACPQVYTKFENTGSNRSQKSATYIFIGEKEKWTNKGTDMQYVAVFVSQYNSSLLSVVPNFRILTLVVAEKSLTE